MSLPDSVFEDLLNREVNITLTQIRQGSTSHNYVREILANKSDRDTRFPWLVPGDFLSGSYARGTKVYPLDDIDVMVVLDGTGLQAIHRGQVLNAEVRGSGAQGSPISLYFGVNGLLSSRIVIELFIDALRQSHPESKISKNGQAVNVWLESYGLGIDIVPCFHIIPTDGSQDFYYIPAGSHSDEWIITNPQLDQKIGDQLNEFHNKKLKPVIKLLKYWNQQFNSDLLRSYHLETIIWHIFGDKSPITSYDSALSIFFAEAGQRLTDSCPDITKLGGYIDTYLAPEKRSIVINRLQQVGTVLHRPALPSPDGAMYNHEGKRWQQVFVNKLNF